MIVQGATHIPQLFKRTWKAFVVLLILAGTIEGLFLTVWAHATYTNPPVDVAAALITAVTIFLAFRVTEAYGRWWEARQLWGKLVNLSRSWTRTVLTMHWPRQDDSDADHVVAALEKELVYRQIAYVNALRIRLREAASYEAARAHYAELEELLPEEELEGFRAAKNVPAFLMLRQGEVVAAHLGDETSERVAWCELNGLLTELTDVQGGCERIKHTAFPDMVTFFTRAVVWFLAPMLLVTVLEGRSAMNDFIEVLVVILVSHIFVVIETLGRDLKNPFENQPNDTPMSALCRTIEIDLRQHLGETDLPKPLQPEDGVLM